MTKQYDNFADLITFTRASTGTYLDSDGLLKTATTNTPRIEYDANGNRKGLLIEEARTNILTYSEEFDNAVWLKNKASITPNVVVAPYGTLTGDKLVEDTNSSEHFIGVTVVYTAGTYTFSIYAKAAEKNEFRLRPVHVGANEGDTSQAVFNLDTGVVNQLSGGAVSASTENVGNGWWRCSVTITVTGTFSLTSFRVQLQPTSYTGDGTSGIYIWGAQLEAGSFPTSYIPTAGAAATRAADVASIPTSAFGYNADKGTVVVEASGLIPTTGQYVFNIHDTTANEQIYLRLDDTTIGRGVVFDNGSVVFNSDATGSKPASNTFVKYALSAAQDDFAVTANGAAPVTDASGTMPLVTTLTLGGRETAASGLLNGHIKSIQYYPRRLTNAQLQRLTS